MRFLLSSALVFLLGFPQLLNAQSGPVVVELYTSQGCSSCPPADEMLAQLSGRNDVIALGLHVDYWDYLGWRDSFAIGDFGLRQERMNAKLNSRYRRVTPQMVVQGSAEIAGANFRQVQTHIAKLLKRPAQAIVAVQRNGDILNMKISPAGSSSPRSDVHVVRYKPNQNVPIKRGENAGRTVSYANIVSSWSTIARWNGREPLELKHRVTGKLPVVVIVQSEKYGPILAAQQLR